MNAAKCLFAINRRQSTDYAMLDMVLQVLRFIKNQSDDFI